MFLSLLVITITTPVVSALKNYSIIYYFNVCCTVEPSNVEVPADILNHFWIQMAVSELKRPLCNRFGSETATNLYSSGYNTSPPLSSPTPGVFYTYFYNHARRPRLEKLLY
jgi:hypothetical protein